MNAEESSHNIPIDQLVVDVFETAYPSVQSHMLTHLVGKVYEAAPVAQRSRLLGCLLRPLGVLSLAAVANGIFMGISSHMGAHDRVVPLEDAQRVQVKDVMALVDFVQQVSVEAVNGLVQVLDPSPAVAGTAAAAVLMTLLLRRSRTRPQNQGALADPDLSP